MNTELGAVPLRVGVAGVGTVGGGVIELLHRNAALVASRAGREIKVVAVSAKDRGRERAVDISPYEWYDDSVALAGAEGIDCLVEAIGGEGDPAHATVRAAVDAGKHVATANKALLAHHGADLAARAEAAGSALLFEAAVAGGIPAIKALGEGLAGNRITRVFGVLNGTCNYILTEMERTGADYADVLAEAQRLGYAEADPATDVGGIDAAHKLALLAALAFGTEIDFGGVTIEGIERISAVDIDNARSLGYCVRLLGVARLAEDGLEQRVQPCLVPIESPLGALTGVTNAVVLEGDAVGTVTLEGPGAGGGPTASAIVADLIDVARGYRRPPFGLPVGQLTKVARQPRESRQAAYSIRVLLADEPGVLAGVAGALGAAGVSIERMQQHGQDGSTAQVVIGTHATLRAQLDEALTAIGALDACLDQPTVIRIEPA